MTTAGATAKLCACVAVLPVMKDAVQVVMVTASEITVRWPPYTADAGTQSPRVVVSSYDIEMTMRDEQWILVLSLIHI